MYTTQPTDRHNSVWPVDWRNSILIICFVIFTPYAWEYLAAFFSGMPPATWFGELSVVNSIGAVKLSVIINSIVSSLFACLVIGMPCGAITNRSYFRNRLVYTGFSTAHLTGVILLEDFSATTLYWPYVSAEIIAFFIWLNLATQLGARVSKRYRKIARSRR